MSAAQEFRHTDNFDLLIEFLGILVLLIAALWPMTFNSATASSAMTTLYPEVYRRQGRREYTYVCFDA